MGLQNKIFWKFSQIHVKNNFINYPLQGIYNLYNIFLLESEPETEEKILNQNLK